MSKPILKIDNATMRFGDIVAVDNLSLEVNQGELIALIGPNGAGKSTTLRSIMHIVKPLSGSISYNTESLLSLNTHDIVNRGITLVPEGRHVFPDLTVAENLKIGAFLRKDNDGIRRDLDFVYDLFPRLKERDFQYAGTLSCGEQQMLAVGRALMAKPKLMMMNE